MMETDEFYKRFAPNWPRDDVDRAISVCKESGQLITKLIEEIKEKAKIQCLSLDEISPANEAVIFALYSARETILQISDLDIYDFGFYAYANGSLSCVNNRLEADWERFVAELLALSKDERVMISKNKAALFFIAEIGKLASFMESLRD